MKVAFLLVLVVEHIGQLPLGYHSLNPSGKQRKIIEKNTDNMETLISHQIPDFVQSAVLPVAFLVFMFMYDWRLSLICLLPILIGFGVLAAMLKGTSEGLAKQYQKSAEDISNAATEYVRGISVVKVFGQTANSFRRYKAAVKEYSDYVIQYALSMENSDSIYNTVINGIFFFLIPGGIILFNGSRDPERMIGGFSHKKSDHSHGRSYLTLYTLFLSVVFPVPIRPPSSTQYTAIHRYNPALF